MTRNNTPSRVMSATDFRRELSKVLETLSDGPVQITDYGEVVAELRSATPEDEAAYTKRWFDLWEALNERDLLNAQVSKLRSYDALQELVAAYDHFTEQGVDLAHADLYSYEGAITPLEVLATIYFDGNPPEDNAVEWFEACCAIEKYARDKGLPARLPGTDDWETDNSFFVRKVQEFGHTPQTLVTFCSQAVDQGVPLPDVTKLLGNDAIPADILAMRAYSASRFEGLVGVGLPHSEAITVFRRDINSALAHHFAEAGVRTAQEIELLIDLGFSADLAKRAARDGMTPEQWRKILPQVQKHSYEEEGLLPFSVIAEAEAQGISLVRWDKNPHVTTARTGYNKATRNINAYPWFHVYDHNVIRLAAAGIAPTYVNDYADLLYHHYNELPRNTGLTTEIAEFHGKRAADNSANFVDDVIELRSAGLTSELIKALREVHNAPAKPLTTDHIRKMLAGGITVARAKELAKGNKEPDTWIRDLTHFLWSYQSEVIQFLEARKESAGWQDVLAVAEYYKSTRKVDRWSKFDFQPMAVEAINLLGTPEKLLRLNVWYLLSAAHWLLNVGEDHMYRRHGKKELIKGKTADAVATLRDEFNAMIKNLSSPAVSEEEHQVEQVQEGRELPEGPRQIEA